MNVKIINIQNIQIIDNFIKKNIKYFRMLIKKILLKKRNVK